MGPLAPNVSPERRGHPRDVLALHRSRARSRRLLDGRSTADRRNRQIAADLFGKEIGNFAVSRNGLYGASTWIAPQGVRSAFALEVATVTPEVPNQGTALHDTVTVSRAALRGRPRKAS